MKRVTYISNFAEGLTAHEILEIAEVSARNNLKNDLTGVLFCFKGIFYQILEGEEKALDNCLASIKADPRHANIHILNIEHNIPERNYEGWKMKMVDLDKNTDPLITPIRKLLDTLSRTHFTLEKYVPEEVLRGIQSGKDPLGWGFQRERKVVLFCDMIGSTSFAEVLELDEMEILLDTYFEISSRVIHRSGGTIDKLIGDGFMASYPFDQADAAVRASVSIIEQLAAQREKADAPQLKLLYAGIGLSAGAIVKGNIGSSIKKDYTLLGDVVNSASRLESATRKFGHAVIFDFRLKKRLSEKMKKQVEKLGRYQPKGRVKNMSVYTIKNAHIPFDRTPKQIREAIQNSHAG